MHFPAALKILLEHAISLLLGKRLYKMHLMSHLKILPAHFHFFYPLIHSLSAVFFNSSSTPARLASWGARFREQVSGFAGDFIHALSGHLRGAARFGSHLH